MNELELSIYKKSIELGVRPSKASIKILTDISYTQLLRLGFKLSLCQKAYDSYNNVTCKNCGIVIGKNRKFCSASCSAIYSHKTNPRDKKTNNCENCGNVCSIKNRFCSKTCHRLYENELFILGWLSGDIIIDSEKTNRTIKRYLVEQVGNKCQLCGWSEVNKFTSKVPLELEHIDGNSRNNDISNLMILCPNCHSLTGTYKALNKGNGRRNRK